MTTKFQGRVTKVEVHEKRVKEDGEEVTKQIGRIVLEFDAASVNVNELAEIVGDEGAYIGVSNTQLRLLEAETGT